MRPEDYKIGWICALPTERAAAATLLDEHHASLPQPSYDNNAYTLGRMGDHNIVIACLPAGVVGIASAARAAAQMRSSFPELKAGLMVGIGGGVPSVRHDIRLGDVVVSQPGKKHSGVIQYDFGRTVQEGRFIPTNSLNRPPDILLNAVAGLQSRHMYKESRVSAIMESCARQYPRRKQACTYLGQENDQLFDAAYLHAAAAQTCRSCLPSQLVIRSPRTDIGPVVHHGLIASANQVMRDGVTRDKLAAELDILCFEMEAAGLMDDLPCLVVRGVCDYADSHKNKQWQDYAAVTAAAYVKELLEHVPGTVVSSFSTTTVTCVGGSSSALQRAAISRPDDSASTQREIDVSRHSLPNRFSDRYGKHHETSTPPANPIAQNTMQAAFDGLRQKVPVEDAVVLDTTRLSDVRSVAINLEAWHRQTGKQHYMRRLKPFLDCIERFSHLVSSLTHEQALINWLWSPIKLILEHGMRLDIALDKLLSTYLGIADSLTDFEAIENSAREQRSEYILAFIYADILEAHHQMYNVFQRKAWKVSFDMLWAMLQDRLDNIKNDLRGLVAYFCVVNAQFDPSFWEAKQKRAKDDYQQNLQQQQTLCLRGVHAWLDVDGQGQENELARLSDKRYPETCEWVLSMPQYLAWSASSRSGSILWISGIPGSGKSVMSANIVNNLFMDAKFTVLYYFCRYSAGSSQNPSSQMLRALISQLISRDPSLTAAVWTEHVRHGHTASIDRLRALLLMLISLCPPARIVVDGLDVFPAAEHRKVIVQLEHILQKSSNRCRILVSSRDSAFIPKFLRKAPTIALREHADLVYNDISCLIQDKLEQLKVEWENDCSVSTIKYARDKLLSGSRGMFLWVELVIEVLQYRMDDEGVRNAVDSLPLTLRDAYDRIFEKMQDVPDPRLRDSVDLCLAWTTYGARSLSVSEILNAVGSGSTISSADRLSTHSQRLLDFCKPLIEINKNGKVDFVHSSVKEYLLDATSKFHITPRNGHLHIALSCLQYVNTTGIFLSQDHLRQRLNQIVTNQRASHQYALSKWLYHVRSYGRTLEGASPDPRILHFLNQFRSLIEKKEGTLISIEPLITVPSMEAEFAWSSSRSIADFLSIMQDREVGSEREENINRAQTSEVQQTDDLTYLSAVKSQFETDVAVLLNMWYGAEELRDIDPKSLAAFCTQHGIHFFFCRYGTCSHASEGFKTLGERDNHESIHRSRILCVVPSCAWHSIGFRSTRELTSHNSKYHSTLDLDLFELENPSQSSQQNEREDLTDQNKSGLIGTSSDGLRRLEEMAIPPHFRLQILNLIEAYGYEPAETMFPTWCSLHKWLFSYGIDVLGSRRTVILEAMNKHLVSLLDSSRQLSTVQVQDTPILDSSTAAYDLCNKDWYTMDKICQWSGDGWRAKLHPAIADFSSVTRAHVFPQESIVEAVTFSRDGKYMAAASDHLVQIFDLEDNSRKFELSHEPMEHRYNMVRSLKFSPDGTLLATGADDGQLRIWEVEMQRVRDVLDDHEGISILGVDFAADSSFIASASSDKTVRLWRNVSEPLPLTKEDLRVINQQADDLATSKHEIAKNFIRASMVDGLRQDLERSGIDPVVYYCRAQVTREFKARQAVHWVDHAEHECCCVAFAPDCSLVAAGTSFGSVLVWAVMTGQLVYCLTTSILPSPLSSISWHNNSKFLFSADFDKTVRIWSLKNLSVGAEVARGIECSRTFYGHQSPVTAVCPTSDDAILVSCDLDSTVIFWHFPTAEPVVVIERDEGCYKNMASCPARGLLATATATATFGADNGVVFWKVGILGNNQI